MNSYTFQFIAQKKLAEFGLIDWIFKLDHSVRRFGLCKLHARIISMSKSLIELNDEKTCMNTLLHEIAHVLVGFGHYHDSTWKQKAQEIGCDGERCYSDKTVEKPKPIWMAYCPACEKDCGEAYRRRRLWHKRCHTELIYKKLS